MNEETFLSALREDVSDEVTWLALADWLDEAGQGDRAELIRLSRRLRTQPVLRRTVTRAALEDRMMELLRAGVRPVVPQVTNSAGMRFALIEPGRFRMGSLVGEPERYDDEASHVVTLTKPFYMGVFAVTQRQYELVTGANPSFFQEGDEGHDIVAGMDTGDFPAECVSHGDAVAFCQRLGETLGEIRTGRTYRLPSEAEWEFACRAGTMTATYLGPALSSRWANFDGRAPYRGDAGPYLGRPCPVGSYLPNAFGLYDMMGNVYQWCADWYDPDGYDPADATDPQGPADGVDHPLRGGSWDSSGKFCRAAWRDYNDAEARLYINGMRVVMVPG